MRKLYRLIRHDLPVHFVLILTNWLPDNVIFLRLRGWLVSHFLGKCGRNLRLGRNVTLYNPSQIELGNDIYIAYGCWFMAGEVIKIEDEVIFGPYCVIVSGEHTAIDGSFRRGQPSFEPIHIGAGTWIASHVTITSGSIVGNGTVIGANSVVRGSIPSNVLAAGLPATVRRQLSK